MDRRTALKQLAVTGAGITMLQACNFGEERLPIALNNLQVTVSQEDLLKSIVTAIIPEGELPGALSLEADKFVWVMADDCMSSEDQQTFMNGVKGFDSMVRVLTEREFSEIPEEERADTLQKVMDAEGLDIPVDGDGNPSFVADDVKRFLGRTKQWTISGYMQSEYIMTEIMPYDLVPTKFQGCIDVDTTKRVNING